MSKVSMMLNGKKIMVFVLLFFLAIPLKGMAAERQIQGGLVQRESRVFFEAGFEALDRDITEDATHFVNSNIARSNTSIQSLRLLAKVGVRVADPLEIYGAVGGSNLDIDDFTFSSNFVGAYGGGVRLSLFREQDPRMPYEIFTDYRYLQFKAHDTVNFLGSEANPVDELLRETIRWTEHTVRFGIMGRHFEYEPYGGVRFSFINGNDHIPSPTQNLNIGFKQRDTFGLFVGTRYYLSPSEQAALFIEGSIIDQFSLAGGIRVSY